MKPIGRLSLPSSGDARDVSDLTDSWGIITPPDDTLVARAQRYVAGHAADVDEARELLAMLGISERVS